MDMNEDKRMESERGFQSENLPEFRNKVFSLPSPQPSEYSRCNKEQDTSTKCFCIENNDNLDIHIRTKVTKCLYSTDIALTGESVWFACHNLISVLPSILDAFIQCYPPKLNRQVEPLTIRMMELGAGTSLSGLYIASYLRCMHRRQNCISYHDDHNDVEVDCYQAPLYRTLPRFEILLTDGDETVMELLSDNTRRNFPSLNESIHLEETCSISGVNNKTVRGKVLEFDFADKMKEDLAVTCSLYRWSNPPPPPPSSDLYSVIIGSDLLYNRNCDPLSLLMSVSSLLVSPSSNYAIDEGEYSSHNLASLTSCNQQVPTDHDQKRYVETRIQNMLQYIRPIPEKERSNEEDIHGQVNQRESDDREIEIKLDQYHLFDSKSEMEVIMENIPTFSPKDYFDNEMSYDGGIFFLAFTRRNMPLSSILHPHVQMQSGIEFVGIVEDGVIDLFGNETGECTEIWRECVLAFRKGRGNIVQT